MMIQSSSGGDEGGGGSRAAASLLDTRSVSEQGALPSPPAAIASASSLELRGAAPCQRTADECVFRTNAAMHASAASTTAGESPAASAVERRS